MDTSDRFILRNVDCESNTEKHFSFFRGEKDKASPLRRAKRDVLTYLKKFYSHDSIGHIHVRVHKGVPDTQVLQLYVVDGITFVNDQCHRKFCDVWILLKNSG